MSSSTTIFHSSSHYKLIEPSLNIDIRLEYFREVLELHTIEFEGISDDDLVMSLTRLLAYSRVHFGDNSFHIALAHLTLGLAYTDRKAYWQQGEQHASDAVLHAENMLTSADQIRVLVEAYYLLGFCRLKQGKTADALEAVTAAINCTKELTYLGQSIDSAFDKHINFKVRILGGLCAPSKVNYLKDALDCPGPKLKNVFVWQILSRVYMECGDTAGAMKAAKQSYELSQEYSDLALQADAARFLGECSVQSAGHNCVEEGIALLRSAVALYTSHFSGLDAATLSTCDVLIEALIKQGLHNEAKEELLGVKEAKVLKFGDHSRQVADIHKSLGSLYLLQNQTKEALLHFKKCLAILTVIQTKPTEVTVSVNNTIKSLEANNTTKPMFKLY